MNKILKTLIITFCMLLPSLALAANGDITACRIKGTTPGDGWVLQIDVESSGGSAISTGGTYTFGLGTNNNPSTAKVALTVTSLGYDNTGSKTTISRTIYGTLALRKPYPDQTANNESVADGTLTLEIALSDFIYAKDQSGAGNSGTDITVSISAGLYSQGGVSTTSYSGTVTNNSTLAYPSSVGRWAWPSYELVSGSSYLLESVIFNRFAQNGKPLAAVKYTCTDEHTNSVTSSAITDMTISTRNVDGMPKVLTYAYEVPTSSFTSGDTITCNFTAYPWVGDSTFESATGVSAPDERLTPLEFLYATSGYGAYAVVDPTNGQNSTDATWVQNSQSSAETTYTGDNTASYTTIGNAAQAIKAYNNANYSRNEPSGGTILLIEGSHNAGGTIPGSTLGVQKTWLTVTRLSTATKANVIINNGSTTALKIQKLKVVDVNLDTTTSASTCLFAGTITTDIYWIDNNIINFTKTALVYGARLVFLTRNDVTTGMFLEYSTKKAPFTLARGNDADAITHTHCYSILGNRNIAGYSGWVETGNASGQQISDNFIYAFNYIYGLSASYVFNVGATTEITTGQAVVQNLFEGNYNQALATKIKADGSTNPSNNIIVWNNTYAASRPNLGYNDSGSTAYLHKNYSVRGNIFHLYGNKNDYFEPANAARIGGWSVGYKVGDIGNVILTSTGFIGPTPSTENNTIGLYSMSPTITPHYVNDKSYIGDNVGGGNYRLPFSFTQPINLIPSNKYVLPYDLDGNRRRAEADDAGCYTRGLGKIF